MKTKLSFRLIVTFLILALSPAPFVLGQVPQGFNYQAIARDGSGPITDPINVRIGILTSLNDADLIWEEVHNGVVPDEHGLFSIVVSTGAHLSGLESFSLIDWTVTPLYIRTKINDVSLGTTQLWSVPYAMVADSLGGPLSKLKVKAPAGSTLDEALFEVKNKTGQTVFAVYNEGVRVYVDNGSKGAKGGFSVGGFGTDVKAGESQPLLVINRDSARIYVYDNPAIKTPKGGFSVGGFDGAKGLTNEYLRVTPDSVRVYVDNRPTIKGAKGGFSVGGFDGAAKGETQKFLSVSIDSVRVYIDDTSGKGSKGGFSVGGFDQAKGNANFLNVATDASGIINPEVNRILWYPLKNAFLTGNIKILNVLDVGLNSFATGYQAKAKGQFSQSMGYLTQALGDYSTAIGRSSLANAVNSFAFGEGAQALASSSYAFGKTAIANGQNSFAFGESVTAGTSSANTNSFAFGRNAQAYANNSFAFGENVHADNLNSYAFGRGSSATGDDAVAMGRNSVAHGARSFAIGGTADGADSKSLGGMASGTFSFSSGESPTASGTSSVAMGTKATAQGDNSFAIGYRVKAIGNQSFAMGMGNFVMTPTPTEFFTEAQGVASIAMGQVAKAMVNGSIALGTETLSSGLSATAIGFHTTAQAAFSTVIGSYNFTSAGYSTTDWVETEPLFVIGNGNPFTAIPSSAVTVLKNGFVGIGTTSPNYALDIVSNPASGYYTARFFNSSGSATSHGLMIHAGSYDTPGANFVIFNRPNSSPKGLPVQIGKIYQNAVGTVEYLSGSDRRMKTEIEDTRFGINDLMKVQVRDFEFIGDPSKKVNTGFIAQELYDVYPEAVARPEKRKDLWYIDYGRMTPLIIKAVQDQQNEIEALKEKVTRLEELVQHLVKEK